MFTISTHDNNIKTCRFVHHHLLRLPEPVFLFFSLVLFGYHFFYYDRSTCSTRSVLFVFLSFVLLSSLSSSSSHGICACFLSDERSTHSTPCHAGFNFTDRTSLNVKYNLNIVSLLIKV